MRHGAFTVLFVLPFVLVLLCFQVSGAETQMQIASKNTLTGEVLKICVVAYEDFSNEIERYSKSSNLLELTLSRIESYEIEIDELRDAYVVSFIPKQDEHMRLRGGGAKYTINKSDYRIAERVLFR